MQCHSLFKNKHQGYYWEYMPSSTLLLQPFWLVLKCSTGDVNVKCYYGTLQQMCFNELLWLFKIECIFIKAYLWWSSALYMYTTAVRHKWRDILCVYGYTVCCLEKETYTFREWEEQYEMSKRLLCHPDLNSAIPRLSRSSLRLLRQFGGGISKGEPID